MKDLLGPTGELIEEVTIKPEGRERASLFRSCGMRIPGKSSKRAAWGGENLVRLGN